MATTTDDADYVDVTENTGGETKTTEKPRRATRRPRTKPRQLMRWNVDHDQFLLVAAIDYLDSSQRDALGQYMTPPVTGQAIAQHLAKVREAREAAGLPIPPRKSTSHSNTQPTRSTAHPSLLPPMSGARVGKAKRGQDVVMPTVWPPVAHAAELFVPGTDEHGNEVILGPYTPPPDPPHRLQPPFEAPKRAQKLAPAPAKNTAIANDGQAKCGTKRGAEGSPDNDVVWVGSKKRIIKPTTNVSARQMQEKASKNGNATMLTKQMLDEKNKADAETFQQHFARMTELSKTLHSYNAVTDANVPRQQDFMGAEYRPGAYSPGDYNSTEVDQVFHLRTMRETAARNGVAVDDPRLVSQAEQVGIVPGFVHDLPAQPGVQAHGPVSSNVDLATGYAGHVGRFDFGHDKIVPDQNMAHGFGNEPYFNPQTPLSGHGVRFRDLNDSPYVHHDMELSGTGFPPTPANTAPVYPGSGSMHNTSDVVPASATDDISHQSSNTSPDFPQSASNLNGMEGHLAGSIPFESDMDWSFDNGAEDDQGVDALELLFPGGHVPFWPPGLGPFPHGEN